MNTRGSKTPKPFISFHTTLQGFDDKSQIFSQLLEEYHFMPSKQYEYAGRFENWCRVPSQDSLEEEIYFNLNGTFLEK